MSGGEGKELAGDGRDKITRILSSMGADRFDPRVVGMLREFMYRYVGEVLKESQIWAEYRTGAPPNAKVELDISDIQMAVEHKIKHKNEFTQRPDQAMLKETADSKNNIDLPQIPKKSLPLPTAKRFCLTADNFQVDFGKSIRQQQQQQQQQQQPKRARTSKWGPSKGPLSLQRYKYWRREKQQQQQQDQGRGSGGLAFISSGSTSTRLEMK